MSRRSLALLALVAGCGGAPTGFGVNVTVDAQAVSVADRARITTAKLTVSGAESYTKSFDISTGIKTGEVRFRYVPGVTSGQLELALDAVTAADEIVASGSAGSIDLASGKAVVARIPLGVPTPDMAEGGPDMRALPKSQGAACQTSDECGTAGGCVDGYCCDSTCGEACKACNVSGKEGICSPLATGATPLAGHANCGPDAKSTCQRDGACNGAGACRLWPLGTICMPGTCNSTTNTTTSDSTCDGSGTCTAGTTITCAPFLCKDASICWPTCSGAGMGQCSSGNVCNGSSCGKKVLGANCTLDSECQNGTDSNPHCVDGVCCNTACAGTCQYCALSSSKGSCQLVPAGQDPRAVCPAGANTICRPGGCTGTTMACSIASQGVTCGASCSGSTPQSTTCDASGNCNQTTNGTACAECKACSVSGLVASCINGTNGVACGPAGYCTTPNNNYGNPTVRVAQQTCQNGSCPAQSGNGCGLYTCYTSGSQAFCGTACGCCGPTCVFNPNAPPTDSFCTPGYSGQCGGSCVGASITCKP